MKRLGFIAGVLFAAAIVVLSCHGDSPTAPAAPSPHGLAASASAAATAAGKVRVCHFPASGRANLIEIAQEALPSHLANGDVPAPASVKTDADCLIPQPPPSPVSVSTTTDSQGRASFIIPDTNIIARITVIDADNNTPLAAVDLTLAAQGTQYVVVAAPADFNTYLPSFSAGSLLDAHPGSALSVSVTVALPGISAVVGQLPGGLPQQLMNLFQLAWRPAWLNLIGTTLPPATPPCPPCLLLTITPAALPLPGVPFPPGQSQQLRVECGAGQLADDVTTTGLSILLGLAGHVTWYDSSNSSIAAVDGSTGILHAYSMGGPVTITSKTLGFTVQEVTRQDGTHTWAPCFWYATGGMTATVGPRPSATCPCFTVATISMFSPGNDIGGYISRGTYNVAPYNGYPWETIHPEWCGRTGAARTTCACVPGGVSCGFTADPCTGDQVSFTASTQTFGFVPQTYYSCSGVAYVGNVQRFLSQRFYNITADEFEGCKEVLLGTIQAHGPNVPACVSP